MSIPRSVAVLSDRDIVKAIEAKRLRIGGFKPESLTPNGYDLAIAEVAIVAAKEETVREGTAKVPPQTRFVVSTLEVKIGERFAQIVFEDLSTPAEKAYAERSGHYQDQKGVRLR